MDLVYIDTNIVLDALKDRDSMGGRDLGTSAMNIFSRSGSCQFEIVVSEWMLEELYKQIEIDAAQDLFDRLEEKIVKQSYTAEDKEEAKEVGGHWEDALHGILAEKSGADCIVTRNADDFRILSSVDAKLPEYI